MQNFLFKSEFFFHKRAIFRLNWPKKNLTSFGQYDQFSGKSHIKTDTIPQSLPLDLNFFGLARLRLGSIQIHAISE